MLREYSNRNDTFRVIKLPLFLCPIIKPVNHRCDQDHILHGTAHTSRMRQAFLCAQTTREGGKRVRMRERDLSPCPAWQEQSPALPSHSQPCRVGSTSHKYQLQLRWMLQVPVTKGGLNGQPSLLAWSLMVRGDLSTHMSRCAHLQRAWDFTCTWSLVQGQLEMVYQVSVKQWGALISGVKLQFI